MTTITLKVNGKDLSRDVEPQTLLVQFIRETLQLTGTHVGCDTAQCGACTVHVNGRAVKSCNMLAVEAQGAFNECHGLQCGFCTPGMVMSAVDLVTHHKCSNDEQVREGLEGNLCRCTGYQNIVKAVRTGAAAMK